MSSSFPTLDLTPEERQARAYRPESSTADVVGASFQTAMENTTLFAYGRNQILEEQNKVGPKLSPEEIIEKYPNFPTKPTEMMTELKAQTIQDRHDEGIERQRVLSNTTGLWKGTVAPFLGSVVGSQMDPIDMTVGMVLGAGIGKAAQAAKMAKVTAMAAGGNLVGAEALLKTATPITQVYLQELAGNMAANTVNEAFVMQANQAELQEYTVKHAAQSMMLSSIFGAGLSTGIGALGKALNKVGPQGHAQMLETTRLAVETGKDPLAIARVIESKVQEDMVIGPEVSKSTHVFKDEEVFGRLEDAEDLAEVFDIVREEMEGGRVSPEEAQQFKDSLEANGFDKRKYYLATKSEGAKLSDSAAQEVADAFDDPKNADGYDERIEQEYNDDTPPESFLKETDEMLDNDLQAMKTQAPEELEVKLKKSEVFTSPEAIKAEKEFEIMRHMDNCMFGGAA